MNRWILVLQTIALPLGYVAVFSFLCWLRASEQGVADHCLTTWLLRLIYYIICRTQSKNDSDGNRTRVTAVKGRCLNRLTTEPLFFSRFLPLAPRFSQRSFTPQDSAFTANSPSRARTYNNSVNSRVLYH